MIRAHTFRKQPMPGGKSRVLRPADGPTVEQENMCEELKRTYTVERRLLDERFGRNKGRPYTPSPRYDGKDTRKTIEDNKRKSLFQRRIFFLPRTSCVVSVYWGTTCKILCITC